MRKLWAVILRETSERRHFLLLALVVGALAPAASLLPLSLSASPEELRKALAFGVAIGYLGLVSLLLGQGLFVSEQATGRAGFHLALPVRAWQVLVGRLAASQIVILVGTTLVVLPTMLIDGLMPDEGTWKTVHVALSLSVLILIAGHVAAVALRLRGRWTLVDLGGALATGLLVAAAVRLAQDAQLLGSVYVLPSFLAHTLLGAFVVGVYGQLRHGGVLRGRLHATFSLVFWLLMVGAGLWLGLRIRHEATKGWADVRSFPLVVADPGGSAFWVSSGDGLERDLSFVVDLQRERVIPIGPPQWLEYDEPSFADRRLVWYSCDLLEVLNRRSRSRVRKCAVRSLDLDAEQPAATELALDWDVYYPPILSPDGDKLVKLGGEWLEIYALPSLRRVARFDFASRQSLLSVGDTELVTVARNQDGTSTISTLELDGSVVSRDVEGSLYVFDSRSGLLLALGEGEQRALVDLEGRQTRVPVPSETFDWRGLRKLSDGSVIWLAERSHRLRRFVAGIEPSPIDLPAPEPAGGSSEDSGIAWDASFLGPELDPGKILVGLGSVAHRNAPSISSWRLLDLHLGPVGRIGSGWRHLGGASRVQERWTTSYLDVSTGQVQAVFPGFKPLGRRIETPEGPEAWLLDARGLPHRFDPRHPDAGLVPVFTPPWEDVP